MNLVGNAIKFTERGEVVVDVDLDSERGTKGNVGLHFRVSDTGIGIPADRLEAVFAPFTQADGSTTRVYGGTGLGLAISSQLASLMGGRIWVESEVWSRAPFHFTAAVGLSGASRSADLASTEDGLEGLRVLVVDDNAVNRRILGEALTCWRMKPTLADGAHAALAILERARDAGTGFSLVLIDAMMPDMDGFTLAERMMDDPALQRHAILMLTSPDTQGTTRRIRGGGTIACLQKPIRQVELKAAILAVLGQTPLADQKASPVNPSTQQALRILAG